MTFQEAVDSSRELKEYWHAGLGALGANRERVTMEPPRAIRGSLDIEAAQRRLSHEKHTWDYGIGVVAQDREFIIWLEVHSADSSHVRAIFDKLESLLAFLDTRAANLKELPARYVWLATKSVAIRPGAQEHRKLSARGILLKSRRLNLN